MNLEKCMTTINKRSLAFVKEGQQLTWRLASLSRFIPKEGDKAYPYFQYLKGNSRFQGTKECEEAFVKPVVGVPIHLYICVTERGQKGRSLQF